MITSSQNPRVKLIKGLLSRKKDRQEHRQFVIEGLRLVEDAVSCGVIPVHVLAAPDLPQRGQKLVLTLYRMGVQVDEVTWKVMEGLSDTETPQGILAVIPFPDPVLPVDLDFALLADTIRDPGNMGAILRSAAAAGVQAAFLSPACVDAFNPKVVRSGMGAHFRMPIYQMEWDEIRNALKERGTGKNLAVLSTEMAGSQIYWDVNLKRPVCIVVSSEADGISIKALELSDEYVQIPMPGKTESLNAAIAASILMFEVVRQRSQP
jgi:TrmH family RNA methyltransferase